MHHCKSSGTEIKDGYRNLVSNGRSIRNCLVAAGQQSAPRGQSLNIIWFGPVDQSNYYTQALLADCVMENFKRLEQKLFQMTRANLQLTKR